MLLRFSCILFYFFIVIFIKNQFFTEPFDTGLVFVFEFDVSKMTSQIFKKTKDFSGIIQLFPDVTDIDAVFGFLCKSNCF